MARIIILILLLVMILMSAPLSDKLMVAANFTLPDDMVFGQAQVIAITAYRFKSSQSSYSSYSSTLSLSSAVFLSRSSLLESCFICLHSTLFLLGFSTNTLSLYKLFRSSSSSNISTTGTQRGQAQIEGQSKLKDGQIFLVSES